MKKDSSKGDTSPISVSGSNIFFYILLAGILVLTFLMFANFFAPILVAGILAVLFYPVYERILKRFHFEWLAALLTILIITAIMLLPLLFLGTQVVHELQSFRAATFGDNSLIEGITNKINHYISLVPANYIENIRNLILSGVQFIQNNVASIFSSIAGFVFKFLLMFISLFYFLKDGSRFLRLLVKLSPLPDTEDNNIISRLKVSVNSVIKGSLLVGLIQGVIAFLGYTIFGLPNPALLGSLTALAALVPGIGTSLILIPVIIFMFLTGPLLNAIGMLAWGALAVGLVDNFLGPILIGRGARIHPLFILFSVLGGLAVFGPVGFLAGPLIVSLLFSLFDIYELRVYK